MSIKSLDDALNQGWNGAIGQLNYDTDEAKALLAKYRKLERINPSKNEEEKLERTKAFKAEIERLMEKK